MARLVYSCTSKPCLLLNSISYITNPMMLRIMLNKIPKKNVANEQNITQVFKYCSLPILRKKNYYFISLCVYVLPWTSKKRRNENSGESNWWLCIGSISCVDLCSINWERSLGPSLGSSGTIIIIIIIFPLKKKKGNLCSWKDSKKWKANTLSFKKAPIDYLMQHIET